MKFPAFVDPQFMDATGLGGLNAAFGTVSGSIASLGSGMWAVPGLVAPEVMTLNWSGLVATVTLPPPWGIVSSGGVVVRAHGAVTGIDTQSYSVDFTSVVPGAGSITAYLAATITSIQQNAIPIPGPPQGHPSYNPNFIPTTSYTQTVFSVALAAVTGGIDNINTFELSRVTLVPSQTVITSGSAVGWQRAGQYRAVPPLSLASGGILTLSQAHEVLTPSVPGLTHTLPLASTGGGLIYTLVNPTTGAWTIATSGANLITGLNAVTGVTTLTVPALGAAQLWGNAAAGAWETLGVNPLTMAGLNNIWTGTNQFTNAVAVNGLLTATSSINATGAITVAGSGNFTGGLTAGGNGLFGGSLTAGSSILSSGGIDSTNFDAGGLNFRATSTTYGAGWRNDNNTLSLLLTASGAPFGTFNSLRPFGVNLTTGNVAIDGTGVGTIFGGSATVTTQLNAASVVASGPITAGGAIGTSSFVSGAQVVAGAAGFFSANGSMSLGGNVSAGGTIVGNLLRASLGAFGGGDANRATIFSDFFLDLSGGNSSYVYGRLPNGLTIQAYNGVNSTGADFIAFPIAFTNACIEVIACEGSPQGWINGTSPTIFGTQQLTNTAFALYVTRLFGTSWALTGGISYRYIALGY
jgi:hypothetical protein